MDDALFFVWAVLDFFRDLALYAPWAFVSVLVLIVVSLVLVAKVVTNG